MCGRQPPPELTFSDFSTDLVSASERKVAVAWETRNEQDIAGFHVWRTDLAKPFDSQRVNVDLVAAEGSRNGSTYRLLDLVPGDGDYIYLIEVVLLDGSNWRYGPARVCVGGDLFIPLILRNRDVAHGQSAASVPADQKLAFAQILAGTALD